MLRRRILEALFKFKSNNSSLSFAYGIQLPTETVKEYGQYVGSNQQTKNIGGNIYYALYGSTSILEGTYDHNPANTYYVNIATYNFKTTSANQQVTFEFKASCENPNDFIGASKLDSTDKQTLAVKLTGTNSQSYTYTVPTAGDHFIKVYYYQHNDGVISNDNAGYFRMIPYDIIPYTFRYKNPDAQTIELTSYYGYNLTSKPDWISLNKSTDVSGISQIIISAQGNAAGTSRNGIIKFTEKYSGKEVSINVSQNENEHPNDILLSYSKLTVPQNYASSTSINVELIGNTSYTISNISNGLTVTPTSGNSNTINVNTGIGNNSNGTFRITGNAGTVKDITVSKERVYCYCDVNVGNSCLCEVNTPFSKKEDDTCPTNNCSANSQISCPQHCTTYNGCKCYGYWACPNDGKITVNECPNHTTCSCDCQAVNTCTCNTNIVCDCNNGDNGSSVEPCTYGGSPCSCYGNQGSKSCSCYGNQGSQSCSCYGNQGSQSCSCYGNQGSQSCSCYGNQGSQSCSCYGNQGSTSCNCFGYSAGTTGYVTCYCYSCDSTGWCNDAWGCTCNTKCKCEGDRGCYYFTCNGDTQTGCYSNGCNCDTYHTGGDCPGYEYDGQIDCDANTGYCTALGCSPDCKTQTPCGDCSSNSVYGWEGCSATCNCYNYATTKWCSGDGASSGSSVAPCTYGGSAVKPCTYGGSAVKPCTYGGSAVKPCTYGGSAVKPCTYGGSAVEPCTYGGTTCSCYGNQGSKACNCYGYHKVESCHSHDNLCSSKDCNAYYPNSCRCNTKTYYPHCDCDNFCKCEGYTAPSVG